jgi:hypothetical protein
MLLAILIVVILIMICNIVLLLGLMDVYKILREVKKLAQCNANQEASKYLQDVGAASTKRKKRQETSKHLQDVTAARRKKRKK